MIRIAAFQANPIVGDLEHNTDEIRAAHERAKAAEADVLVLPEMFLTGYPPEDLVLRSSFAGRTEAAERAVGLMTEDGPDIFLPSFTKFRDSNNRYNVVEHWHDGKCKGATFKKHLPNYGVFDEQRYFRSGQPQIFVVDDEWAIGVAICEDIWHDDVCRDLRRQGASLIIAVNGSPYEQDKWATREQLVAKRVREVGVPMLYLNMVGGQDEIVFDGRSFALQADGSRAFQLPAWQEAGVVFDVDVNKNTGQSYIAPNIAITAEHADIRDSIGVEDTVEALTLGLRDYVRKNGFERVVLGLSGGIDSAVVAALAVRALGADKVRAVMLPSRHTSQLSLDLAKECASSLGISYHVVPADFFSEAVGHLEAMTRHAAWEPDETGRKNIAPLTRENIQARVRGNVLMGASNDTGAMLLTTGNKSEMAVGYATLYGDMSGGFNPLKDVYKTEVFAIARWFNSATDLRIPKEIISRPPSAELSDDQKDTDSLPPYDVLDPVLRGLVDEERSVVDVAHTTGTDEEIVRRVSRMVYTAEYKRRQSAPGVKVTARNFGRDRRYPISSGFRE